MCIRDRLDLECWKYVQEEFWVYMDKQPGVCIFHVVFLCIPTKCENVKNNNNNNNGKWTEINNGKWAEINNSIKLFEAERLA